MPRIPYPRSFFWRDPPPPPYNEPTQPQETDPPIISPSTGSWEHITSFQDLLTSWEAIQHEECTSPMPSPKTQVPANVATKPQTPPPTSPAMINWTLSEDQRTMTYSTSSLHYTIPAKVYYGCGDVALEFILEQLRQRESLVRYIHRKKSEHRAHVRETEEAVQELVREASDARAKLRDIKGRFMWLAEGMGFYQET